MNNKKYFLLGLIRWVISFVASFILFSVIGMNFVKDGVVPNWTIIIFLVLFLLFLSLFNILYTKVIKGYKEFVEKKTIDKLNKQKAYTDYRNSQSPKKK